MNDKKPAHQLEVDEPNQLSLPVGAAEEEVGARLRHQRLKRQILVADAARALKLSPSTIEEIERGDLGRHESLYRRGYLRNYARFLGLDPAPLLEMLQDSDLPPLRSVLPVRSRGPRFDRYLKIATYTVVTTLIIPPLVWIYIQGGLDFLDRDRTLALEPGAAVQDGVSQPLFPQRPAAPAVEAEMAGTVAVTASALPLSHIRPVRDLVAEDRLAVVDLEAESTTPETTDSRSVLMIELMDDSWLEVYAADGRRLEFDLLRAGDQRRFVGEAPFRILAGRGNAVSLTLDGQTLTFEGQERADVVNLELSDDGVIRR